MENLVRVPARAGSTPADSGVFDWRLRSLSDDVTPGGPFFHVGVAQWTEQEISNLPVAGSNPSVGSILRDSSTGRALES